MEMDDDIKEILQGVKEKVIKAQGPPESDDEKEYYMLSYWEDPEEFELSEGEVDQDG